eukprot:PhF_6_TR40408/c2_g1_i2/m.60217
MGCCLSTTVSSFQGQNRDVPFNQNLVNFCAIRSTSLSIGPDSNGLSLSHTTTSNHSSTTSTCITLRSYGNSETTTWMDSEIHPCEILREATDAVRKAMSVTPLEYIVVAGIPISLFSHPDTATQYKPQVAETVREWIDHGERKVSFHDPKGLEDAWKVWSQIRNSTSANTTEEFTDEMNNTSGSTSKFLTSSSNNNNNNNRQEKRSANKGKIKDDVVVDEVSEHPEMEPPECDF